MKRLILVLLLCSFASGAEFLVYNKDHWMDALSAAQIKQYIKKHPNFQAKYDSRYQRGDVVEVREDGFYTSTLKGDLSKWAFRVVCVPGLGDKDAKQFRVSNGTHRSRYNITSGDGKYVETVSGGVGNLQMIDKTTVSRSYNEDIAIILAALLVLVSTS